MTSTRNNLRVIQPKCRTSTYGLNSVRYYGVKLWNELDKQKSKESVSSGYFKRNIVNWTGPACACSTVNYVF